MKKKKLRRKKEGGKRDEKKKVKNIFFENNNHFNFNFILFQTFYRAEQTEKNCEFFKKIRE